ncbi:MAG: imelysin family protein [Burkholderiales bacterium]|nr:imelysin family protein [Burkholderiales bacterium]
MTVLIDRRSWLAVSLSLGLGALCHATGTAALPTRIASPAYTPSDFVRNGLRLHFVPAAQAFAQSTAVLRDRLADGCSLQSARDAWRAAMLDWERLSAVSVGPLLERRSARSVDFWPTRPAMVTAAVQAPPADAAALEQLGAPAKGLPALEWLLWQPAPDPAQCYYAAQLAEACAAEAQAVLADFQAMAQQNLTPETALTVFHEWFSQAVGGFEQLRWKKMGKPARSGRASDWPRATSGNTRAAWQAAWAGLQHFLVGAGRAQEQGSLNGYLAGDNQLALSAQLEAAVAELHARMQAADPRRVASVTAAMQALAQTKQLMEDKIAPELKTMVGFSESDGD